MAWISQLFKKQDEYFDIPSQDLSPRQAREKLVQLASEVLPPKGVETFKDLLALKGTPNGGNAITDDLKYTSKSSMADIYSLQLRFQSSHPLFRRILVLWMLTFDSSSQVWQTEWNSRLSFCPLEWVISKPNRECLGRKRMVWILREQDSCLVTQKRSLMW